MFFDCLCEIVNEHAHRIFKTAFSKITIFYIVKKTLFINSE